MIYDIYYQKQYDKLQRIEVGGKFVERLNTKIDAHKLRLKGEVTVRV